MGTACLGDGLMEGTAQALRFFEKKMYIAQIMSYKHRDSFT